MSDAQPYLSSRQVAALLHVSPATVSRWARASRLPFVRTLGGHRRYPPEPVEQLAEQLTRPSQQQDPGGAPA